MAFSIDSATPQGIQVNRAYCRVEAISLSRTEITFALRRYAAQTGVPAFMEDYYSAPYVLTGVNPIQQAYAYLRTLAEFATATDVLEANQPQQ